MKNFLSNWTLNCATGELLGITSAGAIAYSVNTLVGEPESLNSKIMVLGAMMIAGFVEGSLLGYFQWKVLVKKLPSVPKSEWLFYTILVGVLGWFLGMLPSLIISPTVDNNTGEMDYSNPWVFAFLSISVGWVLGAVFGLFQWFSLRKYVKNAYSWILANALGWGFGIGWIYLFASIPTETTGLGFNILMGVCGGILAGLSVGFITGLFLIRMEEKES